MSEQKKVDPVLGKTESTNYNDEVNSGQETQTKNSDFSEKSQPFHSLYQFIRCAGSADGGHVLHQIHYWISKPNIGKTDKQGRRFVFNTMKGWQKDNFFWLSIDQLERLFKKLEKMGLIETTRAFNANPLDRKKWYTLNYKKINVEELNAVCIPQNCGINSTESNPANNSLESNQSVRLFNSTESEEISDSVELRNAYCRIAECKPQNEGMHIAELRNINTSNTKNQDLQKPNITKNQPTYQNEQPGEVGGSDKNISQTEKLHNDAIAILCAINNARTELQQLRPRSDKEKPKADPLVYEDSDSRLQPIKNILTHHPKASLEVCLNVVAHRKAEAQQNPEANFKHLNCHWAWTEENFERCLKKMQADKKAVSPALAKPVVPKPVDWVPIKQEKASPEEEAENHQKWLESITGMRDQNMAAMFLRMANKEAAPVVEQKPIVTYQYKENFTEYLRNPKKADQDRLVEVEAMAKVLLNQKNDRERGYRKTDQELLDGVEKLAREAQTNRLVVEEVG